MANTLVNEAYKSISKRLDVMKQLRTQQQRGPWYPTLEQINNMVIKRRLREFEGHRAATAKSLGISERQLYYKIRELKL
jgi:transcriptional regulator with PAS, ATPase and Fis domain